MMRMTTLNPFPYRFEVGQLGQLTEYDPKRWDKDPRGLIWMWEPPDPKATYKMGVDTSNGISGWSRYNRVKSDTRVNLSAIEILRAGTPIFNKEQSRWDRTPDVQVCEYAAPVDPFDLAYIANILGRMYHGKNETACTAIIEAYPGPGSVTLPKLMELGYRNIWLSRRDAMVYEAGSHNKLGWKANTQSLQALWLKASRHIIQDMVLMYSPFLVEEFADAIPNVEKGYAESPNNEKGHGDRMRAFNLALWAANEWEAGVDQREPVTMDKPIPWHQCDISPKDMQRQSQMYFDRIFRAKR